MILSPSCPRWSVSVHTAGYQRQDGTHVIIGTSALQTEDLLAERMLSNLIESQANNLKKIADICRNPFSAIFLPLRHLEVRVLYVDLYAVLVAILLPWSTSGVAISISIWLAALTTTIDLPALFLSLKRWVCILPIAIFLLALTGTLWSDVPWSERILAVSPTAKFLVLPLFIYHFERSKRGLWVINAFLISCVPLVVMSIAVALEPTLSLKPVAYRDVGIFVKDRIAQSHEFTLCAVGLCYPIWRFWQQRKFAQAAGLSVLALSFIASMAFVAVSRTALLTIPILVLCAAIYFRWAKVLTTLGLFAVFAGLIWFSSPLLRSKITSFSSQYYEYKNLNEPSSVGLRLEYWEKSLRFFADAFFVGHGTGSTRYLFEQASAGQTGAAAAVIGNPHNQTLYVALQWGIVGIILLYAMWLSHLLLFRGEAFLGWIGLVVVVQNIVSSAFNSHLFDFQEGWIYVMGVGVAGAMSLSQQKAHDPKLSASHRW